MDVMLAATRLASRRGLRRWPLLLLAARPVWTSSGSSASSSSVSSRSSGTDPLSAPVRAVLFDFDGSLMQSEEAHRISFSTVLGRELDHATWYGRCVGRRPLSILQEYRLEGSPPAEELLAQLKADTCGNYAKVVPTTGYEQLLDDLDGAGVRMAIVSSGTREYISRVLDNHGLFNRFETIVAGDDGALEGRFKPDPYPYLLAASKMGVQPGECVAVEDSPAGIQSALDAGMRVVVLRNPANKGKPILDARPVIALVDDFTQLDRTVLACAPRGAGVEGAREPVEV